MKKFFEYLDRYYTKRNQKPMLQNIGLQSFKGASTVLPDSLTYLPCTCM